MRKLILLITSIALISFCGCEKSNDTKENSIVETPIDNRIENFILTDYVNLIGKRESDTSGLSLEYIRMEYDSDLNITNQYKLDTKTNLYNVFILFDDNVITKVDIVFNIDSIFEYKQISNNVNDYLADEKEYKCYSATDKGDNGYRVNQFDTREDYFNKIDLSTLIDDEYYAEDWKLDPIRIFMKIDRQSKVSLSITPYQKPKEEINLKQILTHLKDATQNISLASEYILQESSETCKKYYVDAKYNNYNISFYSSNSEIDSISIISEDGFYSNLTRMSFSANIKSCFDESFTFEGFIKSEYESVHIYTDATMYISNIYSTTYTGLEEYWESETIKINAGNYDREPLTLTAVKK